MLLALLSLILRGLLLGGLFALTGFGLSVAFGIMNVINVAHGDIAILAAYLGLFVCTMLLKLDPFISIIIVVPILFMMGYLCQKFLINRVLPKGMNQPVLVTFALSIIIQNLLLLIFTSDARSLAPVYLLRSIKLWEIDIPVTYTISFVLALVVFIILHSFFKNTYIGKAMRAVPVDPEAAEMIGIRPRVVYNFAMGIAFLVTGLAGILLGMIFTFYPTTGPTYLLIAFGVVIIGGLGSLKGTFLGGLIMGESLILGGYLFGSYYQLLVCYLIVIAVLLIRPQGIFGRPK